MKKIYVLLISILCITFISCSFGGQNDRIYWFPSEEAMVSVINSLTVQYGGDNTYYSSDLSGFDNRVRDVNYAFSGIFLYDSPLHRTGDSPLFIKTFYQIDEDGLIAIMIESYVSPEGIDAEDLVVQREFQGPRSVLIDESALSDVPECELKQFTQDVHDLLFNEPDSIGGILYRVIVEEESGNHLVMYVNFYYSVPFPNDMAETTASYVESLLDNLTLTTYGN
ncbi:MAG: hypothetical protein PHP65_02855 [Bacilli bacterium]|nr:hypothetical protein [Bacilli bacterium]